MGPVPVPKPETGPPFCEDELLLLVIGLCWEGEAMGGSWSSPLADDVELWLWCRWCSATPLLSKVVKRSDIAFGFLQSQIKWVVGRLVGSVWGKYSKLGGFLGSG